MFAILLAAQLSSAAIEAFAPKDQVTVESYHVTYEKNGARVEANVFPTRADANRYEVLFPHEDDRSGEFRGLWKSFLDEIPDSSEIWCNDVREIIDLATEEMVKGDLQTAVYRYQRIPADQDNSTEVKYAKAARVDVTFQEGEAGWQVTGFRQFLTEPFKPMFIAKMTSLDMMTNCAVGPNGRMYWAETVTSASGTVLGRSIVDNITLNITDLKLTKY